MKREKRFNRKCTAGGAKSSNGEYVWKRFDTMVYAKKVKKN